MEDIENVENLAMARRGRKKIEMDNTKQQMSKIEVVVQVSDVEGTEFPKEYQNKTLRCGFAEMQGKRPFMEDAVATICNFNGDEAFIAVYDGHAGADASKLIGEELHNIFEAKLKEYNSDKPDYASLTKRVNAYLCNHEGLYNPFEKDSKKRTVFRRDSMVDVKNYIEDSFEEIQLELLQEEEAIQVLMRESFLEMSERVEENKFANGATAVVAYITDKKVYVAGAGDSRAVLCRNGCAQRLTTDHRGKDDEENRRIREVGGFVASGRVNGVISVARAIGDNYLEPMVCAYACTNFVDLSDQDSFLILACDGVWDHVSDDQAIDLVKEEKDPRIAAIKLRDFAYKKGSTDNISCSIVFFEKMEK